MNTKMNVPYIANEIMSLEDTCEISVYTPEELTKLFLVQCYSTGMKNAIKTFNINEKASITDRLMRSYVMFVSCPIVQDAFGFFKLYYDDASIIDILLDIFSIKISAWCTKSLPCGSAAKYDKLAIADLLQNNFAIKSTSLSEKEAQREASNPLTEAFLFVLNNPNDPSIRKLFSSIISQNAFTIQDANLVINTISDNADLCRNYFYSVLLLFMKKGYTYDDVLKEVRLAYEI